MFLPIIPVLPSNSPKRWRENHPKCKFCKYMKAELSQHGVTSYICKVKDKFVNENLPRYFCKCYEVDRKQIDNL